MHAIASKSWSAFLGKLMAAVFFAAPVLVAHLPAASAYGTEASLRVAGNCNSAVTTASDGGTLDPTAEVSTTQTGAITNCVNRYPAGTWTGQASASANLGTGQLRAFADGETPESNFDLFNVSDPARINVRVDATAALFDTIRLIVPVDFTNATAQIRIHYDVDFEVSIGAGRSSTRNEAQVFWTLLTTSPIHSVQTNACDNAGVLSMFTGFGCHRGDVLHILSVPVANPEISLRATLRALASNEATADAAATGSLSLELPAGFRFESDSDVLLQQTPGASVPEPGILALLGVGAGGLILHRRKRRVTR